MPDDIEAEDQPTPGRDRRRPRLAHHRRPDARPGPMVEAALPVGSCDGVVGTGETE